MKFTQLLPAIDWFVVNHRRLDRTQILEVTRIVAWGLNDDGHVFGIVPSYSYDDRGQACLVPSEETQTKYKHLNELSEGELASLRGERAWGRNE